MSFKEISKKLIKLNTWKNISPNALFMLILGGFVTKSVVYAIIFSFCYTLLILVLLHMILVLKVKRKLKAHSKEIVFYCQNKKSALLVHHFLIVEEAGKLALMPFEYGVTNLPTDLTIEMIKDKDTLNMDGKEYHLIRLI